MYVLGRGFQFQPGQLLLIETQSGTSADQPIRQIVQLLAAGQGEAAIEMCDPLYPPPPVELHRPPPPVLICPGSPPGGTAVTLISWVAEDALTVDRDLTCTILAGNLIAATQGQTQSPELFYIPQPPAPPLNMAPAIVRTGPNDTPASPSLQYLYTLQSAPLAWLQPADPSELPQPEVVLFGQAPGDDLVLWQFQRWLLDAQAFDSAFTVDAARSRGPAASTASPRTRPGSTTTATPGTRSGSATASSAAPRCPARPSR